MLSSNLQITYIPILHITGSPLNPRKHFDEAALEELTDSIAAEGVLQPILVRPIPYSSTEPGPYEVVAGERRLRAVYKLHARTSTTPPGADVTIPAIIRDLTDDEALEIMITENLQRRDIHPMEEAAGFAQLVRVRHMDIKELAARVGKSPSFVAQRLKLTDLIEPIQQFFYRGWLLVKDALTLSQLRPEDQQSYYDDEMEGHTELFEVSKWELSKYQNNLSNAPFDITDASLLKGQPSCTVCPYNSAAALLFPDQSEPICSNPECFRSKCDITFNNRLAEAEEDPAVVLISDEYSASKATKKLMESHHGILRYDQYDKLRAPEMPERDWYTGDNETPEDDEADYQKALEEYKDDLEKYNRKISSGAYTKALIIDGDNKGQYIYVKIDKAVKSAISTATASAPQDTTAQDIKDEIDRIKSRESRAIELDDSKRWTELYKLCDPLKYTNDARSEKLSEHEINAFARAIYRRIGYSQASDLLNLLSVPCTKMGLPKDEDGWSIPAGVMRSPHILKDLIRYFIVAELRVAQIGGKIKGDVRCLELCLDQVYPAVTEQIATKQRDIATKRAAKVASTIKTLQQKLKTPSKNPPLEGDRSTQESEGVPPQVAPRSVKSSSKKGKGIKALITDPQSE